MIFTSPFVAVHRRVVAAIFALFAATVLVACGTAAPDPVDSANSPQPIAVTDIVGRQVQLDGPAERIFLGEGRLFYLTAILDREDPVRRIAGWADDMKIADLDTYEAYRAKFPEIEQLPEVGALAQGGFSTEAVIAMQPDVVVLTKQGYENAQEIGAVDTMAKVGIPTVVVDFREHPLETTVPSVEILGEIMGQQDRAVEFNTYYNEQIDLVRTRVVATEQKPTTFLYVSAGLSDCCATYGQSNLGELVEFAGGQNLGSQILPGDSGSLSKEQVFASDPDHIIVTGSNWSRLPNKAPGIGFVNLGYQTDPAQSQAQLRAIVEQPGWSSLSATQNGGIHALWHQFYSSPYNFLAALQMAKWQHPDAFADIDPTEEYRSFHERFLPIPYSGTFWVTQ